MLIRIVHMYFTQEGVEKFLEIFGENYEAIRNMDGCFRLELLQDLEDPGHFTTISQWMSAEYLESYRSSPLFKNVWGRVKPLFARRPLAYSMGTAQGH